MTYDQRSGSLRASYHERCASYGDSEMNARALALIAIAAIVVWAVMSDRSGGERAGTVDAVAACTERGIRYFREIEAYPRLSNGRLAEEVAAERCGRTTTAFP